MAAEPGAIGVVLRGAVAPALRVRAKDEMLAGKGGELRDCARAVRGDGDVRRSERELQDEREHPRQERNGT